MKESFLRCILFCTVFMLLSSFCAFSQSITVVKKVNEDEQDFKLLKIAQNYYEDNEYGSALSYAQKAKNSRKQETQWRLYILQNLQKQKYIRKAGDDLTVILSELQENNQRDAYNLIYIEVQKYGIDYFNNSLASFEEFMKLKEAYPEADYLIGKIYRLEGETELSAQYFLEAYMAKDFLDIPDVQYDILYDLAQLSYDSSNMEDYEKYLLLIVKDNRYYTDPSFMDAMISLLTRENEENAVEKFFLLYRCEDYFSISALNLLCKYYIETSDNEKALKCGALGAISSVTKIDNTLKDRLINYKYVDLGTLLDKCSGFSDILEWGNEEKIWELMYNFADAARTVKPLIAIDLFKIYSSHIPEVYWQKRAELQLVK